MFLIDCCASSYFNNWSITFLFTAFLGGIGPIVSIKGAFFSYFTADSTADSSSSDSSIVEADS